MAAKRIQSGSPEGPARKQAKTAAPKRTSASSSDPTSLEGLRIVVTGVTETIGREELEHKLKKAGAQITSAVSGLTDILVCGSKLEDGDRPIETGSKFKKAKELLETGKTKKDLKILNEAEFLDLFPELKPPPLDDVEIKPPTPPGELENLPPKPPSAKTKAGYTIKTESGAKVEPKSDFMGEMSELAIKTASMALANKIVSPMTVRNALWSEKWRPTKESDFCCNADAYRILADWMRGWSPTQTSERGALLTGPPGIGKTSAVIALAKAMNLKLIEFNASDTRSQKQLQQSLSSLVSGGQTLSKGNVHDDCVILMDESDGLSSGDRGGSQELIRMIKISKVPIVCTCNDRQHPKVRSLAKSCKVIEFKRPDRQNALRRAIGILKFEGVSIPHAFLESLFDVSGGDMRQFLNSVQLSINSTINAGPLGRIVLKDLNGSEDAFAAVRRLLAKPLTYRERIDIFFTDYDLVPLIVHENYPKVIQSAKSLQQAEQLRRLMAVADSFAFSDIINTKIRSQQHWELLPELGFLTCVLPLIHTPLGQPMFRIDFPRSLGRISSTNKHKREVESLTERLGYGGRRLLVDGYLELLGDMIVKPLMQSSVPIPDRVSRFLEEVEAHNLTKDLVVDNLMDIRYAKSGNPYDMVETKVKSALTRAAGKTPDPGSLVRQGGATRRAAPKAKSKKKASGSSTPSKSSSTSSRGVSPKRLGDKDSPSPLSATVEGSEDEDGEALEKEKQQEEMKMAAIF